MELPLSFYKPLVTCWASQPPTEQVSLDKIITLTTWCALLEKLACVRQERCFPVIHLHPIWKLYHAWPKVVVFPYDSFSYTACFCHWTPEWKLRPRVVSFPYDNFFWTSLFCDWVSRWKSCPTFLRVAYFLSHNFSWLLSFLWQIVFPPWQVGLPKWPSC